MNRKHGWFEIPGIQTGERKIGERTTPLRLLLNYAKGASILDVGCAEGCISKWLIDHGKAASMHGIELHAPWIETARQIMPTPPYNVRFSNVSLMDWADRERFELTPGGYDIVLALNVIQKIRKPRPLLMDLAALAKSVFVYSGPDDVLMDIRSGYEKIDVPRLLKDDFKLLNGWPVRVTRPKES